MTNNYYLLLSLTWELKSTIKIIETLSKVCDLEEKGYEIKCLAYSKFFLITKDFLAYNSDFLFVKESQ